MKKVYQTIVDAGKGNCMQAACASLFDLSLEDVPNFIETHGEVNANLQFWKFVKGRGYHYCAFNSSYINGKDERKRFYSLDFVKELLEYDGGIKGYFYASVLSQTFKDCTHAVIINKEMNIVHDPNPNGKALLLKPEDILSIETWNKEWYIDEGKIVTSLD